MSMEWRKPPQDRFIHLFIKGQRLSLCNLATSAGQKIKDLDPTKELHGARKLGMTIITCPHCRSIGRQDG